MARKSFLLALCCMIFSITGFAQNNEPDFFEVGPYEVDYYGVGDYHAQLKKGVDLYNFFNLKKDTVINVVEPTSEPVKSAFQVGVFVALPRYVVLGASNVFGIEGAWKMRLSQKAYFNAGLSLGARMGKFHRHTYDTNKGAMVYDNEFTETVIEVGVPLSIEFTKLDRKKASLYCGIGVVPTFYTGAQGENGDDYNSGDDNSKSGFYVAPRLEVGGYIPMNGKFIRIGGFYQNNINCTAGDYDIYKNRIGRGHVGANISLVF